MPFKPIYIKTNWGNKNAVSDAAIKKFQQEGYSGLELNVAATGLLSAEIVNCLHANEFLFIAQQWLPPAIESVDQYIGRLKAGRGGGAGGRPGGGGARAGGDGV